MPARSTSPTALAWLLLLLLLCVVGQGVQAVPFDTDTAYHFYVGRLIASDGWPTAMPGTRFSWLADHYSDSEPLFHLLFAVASPLGYVPASRLLGVALDFGIAASMYALLVRSGVRSAGPWTVIGLATSGYWLLRIVLVRPYLPAIILVLWLVHAAWSGRWRLTFGLSALFPIAYIGFHVGLVLVAIVEVARVALDRRVDLRQPAAVVLGSALGLGLHPYFPEILSHFWVENGLTLGRAALLDASEGLVGPEFAAPNGMEIARGLSAPLAFTAVAAGCVARFPGTRRRALPFVLVALAFAVLTLRSQRFVEYLVPFATLAVALAIPDAAQQRWSRALLIAMPLWLLGWSGTGTLDRVLERQDVVPPETVAILEPALPVGAKVYTCDWGFTGELLRVLPDRQLMIALDPMLFAYANRALYDEWVTLKTQPGVNPAARIHADFDSDYVICERTREVEPLRNALLADPGARLVARRFPWEVWSIAPDPR